MSKKAYDLQFFIAPALCSFGTMICANCGKPINGERDDFRAGKVSDKDEGWRFVTHHRHCLSDQAGFHAAERSIAERQAHQASLLKAAQDFRAEWRINDLDELIASLSCPTR